MTSLTIVLLGDLMIGRSFNQIFENNINYQWLDSNIKDWLEDSDLIIGNLETTITNSKNEFPKRVFHFQLNPEYFPSVLHNLNISHVSLANNHILDFQQQGLIDTLDILKENNVSYAGAGKNLQEAMSPVILNRNNIKIMLLSASTHPEEYKATDKPGAWIIDLTDFSIMDYIKQLKHNFDGIFIFSIHWGLNYSTGPSDEMRIFGRELIKSGIDIIHGHSAHHLLEVEEIFTPRKGLIFYSLGDFIDDYAIDNHYRNDLSAAVKIEIINNKYIINALPIQIKHMKTIPVNKIEEDFVMKLIEGNRYL
jgi:poly-gamma-glutamate synthesis protein (capsule biosynthesis protein)